MGNRYTTDWDSLIALVGPYPELLADAAGVHLESAKRALRRRGFTTGHPGQPKKDRK